MKQIVLFAVCFWVLGGVCQAEENLPVISVLGISGNNSRIQEECAEAIMSNLGRMKSACPVERSKLGQVFSEQALIADGIVETLRGAAQATGLNYVLIGNVNVQKTDSGTGSNYTPERTVTLNLRLVDACDHVGEVIWSGQDTSTCLSRDAVEAADEAVYDCMRQLYEVLPIRGCILRASGAQCCLDIGRSSGIEAGDKICVQDAVETLLSPRTGKSIRIGVQTAILRVTAVYDDYCVAELAEGDQTLVRPGVGVWKKLAAKPRTWLGLWSHKVKF